MLLYRLLLRLYPASFRSEYGEEMCRLFEERRRGTRLTGRIALWVEAVGDAIATAPRIHMDVLRQDLRYGARSLARTPAFAATAIAVSALGIGANTAVFSLHDPGRLVQIWENEPSAPQLERRDPE